MIEDYPVFLLIANTAIHPTLHEEVGLNILVSRPPRSKALARREEQIPHELPRGFRHGLRVL